MVVKISKLEKVLNIIPSFCHDKNTSCMLKILAISSKLPDYTLTLDTQRDIVPVLNFIFNNFPYFSINSR